MKQKAIPFPRTRTPRMPAGRCGPGTYKALSGRLIVIPKKASSRWPGRPSRHATVPYRTVASQRSKDPLRTFTNYGWLTPDYMLLPQPRKKS